MIDPKESKVNSVRLRMDIHNKIAERAKKENRNFSNMVGTILIEYFALTGEELQFKPE